MEDRKKYDIAFEHYRGYRRYTVSHPDFGEEIIVAAPDDVAAIVAAAEKWQVRWQSFEFYAFCKVVIYNKKKLDKTEGTD